LIPSVDLIVTPTPYSRDISFFGFFLGLRFSLRLGGGVKRFNQSINGWLWQVLVGSVYFWREGRLVLVEGLVLYHRGYMYIYVLVSFKYDVCVYLKPSKERRYMGDSLWLQPTELHENNSC
jgi:hypothetical protein